MRIVVANIVVFIALLTVGPAWSQSERMALCFPGGPGSTTSAQPTVDQFLEKLASTAGWKSASGHYYPTLSTCRQQVEGSSPPTVVMVPLDLFLDRQEAWKLQAAVTLVNAETSGQFHVYAKRGLTLDALKGQGVATSLRANSRFLSRVAFAGAIDLDKDVKFERSRSARKAIKKLIKGDVAAVVIDDVQYRSFKGLPLTKELVAIHSGPELPGALVAGLGAVPKGLKSALLAICKKDGKACKDMRITGFGAVPVSQLKAWKEALK